jgi:hypothetical protein
MPYHEMLKIWQKDSLKSRFQTKNDFSKLSGEFKKLKMKMAFDGSYNQHVYSNFEKKAIFITSRVHPGETQASFSLEGLVHWLISDFPDAKTLRSKFIIYVIPMLNIDGVIHGNHRTDLAGFDGNR